MPVDEDTVAKANLLDRIYASTNAVEIANKAVISRYVEATNQNELDVLDELVYAGLPGARPRPRPEARAGRPQEGLHDVQLALPGPAASSSTTSSPRATWSSGAGVISGTHEGEFFGIPGTGKKVHWTGTRLFRLKDLKVVEGWVNIDMMSLMQQMGVVPTPPGPDPSQLPTPAGS